VLGLTHIDQVKFQWVAKEKNWRLQMHVAKFPRRIFAKYINKK
jgi:hypothetical protein